MLWQKFMGLLSSELCIQNIILRKPPGCDRCRCMAVAELAGCLKDGRMKSKEDVVHGINTFPETLLKLFNGENFDKLVLQVATD